MVFPGGHVESGETPDQAIRREIWEELSLKITKLGKPIIYFNENGPYECYFVCEVANGEPKLDLSGTEKITADDWYNPEWVEIDFAKNLDTLYPNEIREKYFGL